ncbi:hypothetical protein AB0L85_13355 [Streptomyces sp. NPDC052051]|uniref:hypothetical protein n=1 Tax=Streptomyces sp. NPDC052051 TaxID=3154649 RepID=UPI003418948D
MTTGSTPQANSGYVDAPTLHIDLLSKYQLEGRSCCWCSGTPDRGYPVRRGTDRGRLYACTLCAGMYGVPPVEVDA